MRVSSPIGLAIVFWCAVTVTAHAQPGAGPGDLKAVQAAWQGREDAVRSLRATFNEESTIHRAQYLRVKATVDPKYRVPDKDHLNSFAVAVSLKGDRFFRHSLSGREWRASTNKQERIEYLALTNPETRSYYEVLPDSGKAGDVGITDSHAHTDERKASRAPLMAAVRPSQRVKLSAYTVTGQTVPVEGRPCVELSEGSKAATINYLYLDPASDWVVRRWDEYTQGKLTRRISAEYATHPVARWLPSSWSWVVRDAQGNALESGKVTAVVYDINPDIPDDEFRLRVPPKTFVVKDVQGKQSMSVVADDGGPGVERPLDPRVGYEQLVEANESSRRQRVWLWGIGAAVAVMAVAAAVSWRRRALTTGTPPTP